jgi:3-phosphoglycerate kinase
VSIHPNIYILNTKLEYIILTSHYGRPKEKSEKYSLRFLVPILEEFLDQHVYLLEKV